MAASEGVDCGIRGLRYVDLDTHILATGPRPFVAQPAFRYAPGRLVAPPRSSAPPVPRPWALGPSSRVGPSALPATLGPSALGVTDLSALLQLGVCLDHPVKAVCYPWAETIRPAGISKNQVLVRASRRSGVG